MDTALLILFLIFAGLALFTLLLPAQGSSESKYPVINGRGFFEYSNQRVKKDFVANGRKRLREGLQKYGGKPFRIITDFGTMTILSPDYAQELRNIDQLSHVRAIAKLAHADYPGFEAFHEFAFGGDIIQDCIKLRLTQALGTLTGPLSEESALTLQQAFTDSREWHPITAHKTLLFAVARISSRLFLGDKLCRDKEWLAITSTYTYHIASAVNELNAWPAFLRPFVCRFLPHARELIRQIAKANSLMGRVLEERAAQEAAGKKPDYIDAIEWFKQVANGRKYDPVNVQLTLSMVAIHTTADTITQLMFDLAKNPEYIQPLRQEIIEVLGKHGWEKMSLYNMKLLDSVLKESQRLRPINDTSLQRLAMDNVTLSDGTFLPRNSVSAVASVRHWDAKYYTDPEKFDGYRFLKMRGDPGKESVAQFVSTSPNHLGFGHGQHACPGRFFASNEIKIMMCHILLKYDWRVIPGKEPKVMAYGFNLFADHHAQLDVRRRQEELDIDNL